jgi:hypothetical protein
MERLHKPLAADGRRGIPDTGVARRVGGFGTGCKSDINLIGERRDTLDGTSRCLLRRTNKATIEA